MRLLKITPLLLISFVLQAVAEEPYEHTLGYFECTETLHESEFSEWHLISDMQRTFNNVSNKFYWVYQEGRNYKGVSQIRWIQRERPEENFERYYIYGMLTADDFYSKDMNLQKSGYERVSVQVFVDNAGVSRHQATWVKRVPDEPEASAKEGVSSGY